MSGRRLEVQVSGPNARRRSRTRSLPAETITSLLTAPWYFFPPCKNSTPVACRGEIPARKVILVTVAPVRTNKFSLPAFALKYACMRSQSASER